MHLGIILNIKNFKLEKSNNIFLVDNKSHLVVDGVKYFGRRPFNDSRDNF